MSKWLNNRKRRFNTEDIFKPCHVLRWCPYGQLVEEFPLPKKGNDYSCEVFGHECPVFYHAEDYTEEAVWEAPENGDEDVA